MDLAACQQIKHKGKETGKMCTCTHTTNVLQAMVESAKSFLSELCSANSKDKTKTYIIYINKLKYKIWHSLNIFISVLETETYVSLTTK